MECNRELTRMDAKGKENGGHMPIVSIGTRLFKRIELVVIHVHSR